MNFPRTKLYSVGINDMNLPDGLFTSASEVFTLFLIPIGGGIPAGVILAKARGFDWRIMMLLYFMSDLVLACVFEILMHMFIDGARRSPFLGRWAVAYKESLRRSGLNYGISTGPFALILISFGVDPMTGRAAARVAGHGFLSGWAIAICGDMIFFTLIMVSTLWLNSILGDGTLTAVIIMIAMIGLPVLIERWRASRNLKT
jgi:hypothetical protein